MKEKFDRFMEGRYGTDTLNHFLMVLSLGFLILSWLDDRSLWSILLWATVILSFFRMLSTNLRPRAMENEKFLHLTGSIRKTLRREKRRIFGENGFAYFPCPSCGAELRVPKGKGKIRVRCPHCKHEMTKRT